MRRYKNLDLLCMHNIYNPDKNGFYSLEKKYLLQPNPSSVVSFQKKTSTHEKTNLPTDTGGAKPADCL